MRRNRDKKSRDINFEKLYRKVGKKYDTPPQQTREEMQIAIDAAWNSTDAAAQEMQRTLFPNGKPSVEEFIAVLSEHLKKANQEH